MTLGVSLHLPPCLRESIGCIPQPVLPWLACSLSGTLQSSQSTSPQEGKDYSHGLHLAFLQILNSGCWTCTAISFSTDISLRLVLHLPPLLLLGKGYKVKAPYPKPQYHSFIIHPLFAWKSFLQHEEVLFITIAIMKDKQFLSGFDWVASPPSSCFLGGPCLLPVHTGLISEAKFRHQQFLALTGLLLFP